MDVCDKNANMKFIKKHEITRNNDKMQLVPPTSKTMHLPFFIQYRNIMYNKLKNLTYIQMFHDNLYQPNTWGNLV